MMDTYTRPDFAHSALLTTDELISALADEDADNRA